LLCWLAQIVIKYPGVLMWDTYQQIKQFTGEYPALPPIPPWARCSTDGCTGWAKRWERQLRLFSLMLAQVAALLGVLACRWA
jgi:hypothetical protein